MGYYPDGRIGELFIDMHKCGSALRAWASAVAMLISIMLQHDVPMHEIVDALRGFNSELDAEVDVIGHENIRRANGALDFIARFLEDSCLHPNSSLKTVQQCSIS